MVKSEDPSLSVHFRKMCSVCMVVSGIKVREDEEAIDQVTEKFLFDYITKHYGNYTFLEIEKAFYFNSIGKLDHRIEHFGSFDTTFVSKVLTEWLVLKNRTRQRISSLLPPPESVKVPTPEESYNGLLAYCQKNGDFPVFWSWSLVYQHMEEMLMIEMSLEEKRELYDAAIHRLKNKLELDLLNVKDTKELNERRNSIPEDAKLECRKILVQKYLKF